MIEGAPIKMLRYQQQYDFFDAAKVGDAVDHATPGTPILIHAHDQDGAVVAEITNQDPSIPADLLPLIFEAFHRGKADVNAKTKKRAPGGGPLHRVRDHARARRHRRRAVFRRSHDVHVAATAGPTSLGEVSTVRVAIEALIWTAALERAEAALYRAKREGRNRVVLSDVFGTTAPPRAASSLRPARCRSRSEEV